MLKFIQNNREITALLAVVLLFVLPGFLDRQYLSVQTLTMVYSSAQILILLALGAALVMLTRNIDVSVGSTVGLSAIAVGVEGARIAKSMSFKIGEEPIIIVMAGDAKVDNSRYKAQFHTKAKMLTFDEAHTMIGHDPGGVCSFALPDNVKTYLDISLKRFDTVFPAAGSSNSAIELTCDELEKYSSNFMGWIDVTKGWRPEEKEN